MKKTKKMDWVRANRRADREWELENERGFVTTTKVHKSKKEYNRKRLKRELIDLIF